MPLFAVICCNCDGMRREISSEKMTMNHSAYIEFQCLRGIQGSHPQFAAIWSAATLLRLLTPLAQSVLEDQKSGLDRCFMRQRSKELVNPESSLSDSPIVVAVPDEFEFIEIPDWPDFGTLRIPASSELNILDGLHRVAALLLAELPLSRLAKESIPVLILPVREEQRMIMLRESLSKRISNKRSRISIRGMKKRTVLEKVKDLFTHSSFLRIAVAVGKSSLAPRARHLLTHTCLAKACNPIFSALEQTGGVNATAMVAEYWQCLSQFIGPWRDYLDGKVSAHNIRKTTILASSTVIAALGRLGAQILIAEQDSWREKVERLAGIDWSRNSPIWKGRVIGGGILLKGVIAEVLTGNILKQTCGLALQTDEQNQEGKFVHESH